MAQRISFLVKGRVQGVSFRYYTKKHARAYNITGWVKNTPDGNVQGEAQGEQDAIQKLVKDLGIGPSAAKVDKLEKQEIDVVEGESGFSVRS
ncbi:Acylphosphatase family protein [Bisporella sp. PMI_857]|nr:Acylphosphatase family protein [Bisporella sp. PMI_857]